MADDEVPKGVVTTLPPTRFSEMVIDPGWELRIVEFDGQRFLALSWLHPRQWLSKTHHGVTSMFNSLEAYAEAGRKSAIGRNRGDEAFAKSWQDHFRAMHALESTIDKRRATKAYDEAYRVARIAGTK